MKLLTLAAPLLLSALAAGQDFKLGSKAGDFTLRDLAGKEVAFGDLNAVYQDYSAKGVKFIFVNANDNEPLPWSRSMPRM